MENMFNTLGGYVKFFGYRNVFSQSDRDEILKRYKEEDRKKLFTLKPLYQRSLIVFGGPLANFILAVIIFLIVLFWEKISEKIKERFNIQVNYIALALFLLVLGIIMALLYF